MNVREMVQESLRIEGIIREPRLEEVVEFNRFMGLSRIDIEDLEQFIAVYQPNARLRVSVRDNVFVGKHMAPVGGPAIGYQLEELLRRHAVVSDDPSRVPESAYRLHHQYETLHPFTDCNGRSGRMIWYWMMGGSGKHLGFLHTWYYQSLEFRGV